MKLQRWHVARGGLDQGDCLDERGEWVRWADVLAWRDSIRAAVVAERSEVEYVFGNWSVPDQKDTLGRWWDAQSALDALLAGGGA